MLRLAKYLRPFNLLIFGAVILLFVQALSDLALPNYMGDIVNVGIQQSGIETAAASAVRQAQMDRLLLFVNADDKATVLSHYSFVQPSTASADQIQTYPTLATEPIYLLDGDTANADLDALNTILAPAWVAVSGIQQAIANPDAAAASQLQGSANFSLPAGVDPFVFLASPLAGSVRTQILQAMDERFAVLGERFVSQSSISAVKAEYSALGMDTTTLQNNYIVGIGAVMLLVSLLSGVSTVAVGFLSAQVAAGLSRDLRRDVFRKVSSFSNAEFDKFSVSSLITRSTNDINQLQLLIFIMIRMVIYAPILAIGGLIMAVRTDAAMWWTIAVAVGALLSVIIVTFSLSLPRFRVIQTLTDRLNLVVRENLSGMMVVRAFNTQAFELQRVDRANRDLTDMNLFVNRVMVLLMPAMMFVMSGVSVLIIWVGAHQVAASSIQVGDLIAFMQYAIQIVTAFLFLSFLFIILPRASVSAERIADVLAVEPSIKDPEQAKQFPAAFNGTVEFRNVSFRYPGAEADVLHNISFTAQPGQTTALIGSTGSGKSTLVNLIPRFYDVTGGQILLDGVDIRDVTQSDLRDKVGYIPQQGILFTGTIDSNLRFADQAATAEQITEATDIAQATAFIAEKTDGLGSEISQGGTNVSGGQRQRLSIARALVKRPPIYIFDDSFSALDFKTDATLRRALKEYTGESTLLIVAQRISTIKTAEQIIVLDEGRIVGIGTHAELMNTCETYREIALSQLSIEELA